jgi:hypothetical protein
MLQLWPVQLFDGSIKGITVNMDYRLRQVACHLKLSKVVIGATLFTTEVGLFKLAFVREDALYLLRQNPIPGFLVVEELGSLRCIVDYLGNLDIIDVSAAAIKRALRTVFAFC